MSEHGTRSRYVVSGCRCDACRAANTAYQTLWRRRRGVQPLRVGPQVGHGTSGMYHRGCKCDECRAGNTRRKRAWLERRAAS